MSALGQRLIEIVRAKAAENPYFTYTPPRGENGRFEACAYVRDRAPSCIIGHALFGAGVIDHGLEYSPNNMVPFHTLVDALQLELETAEIKWLGSVQKYQDNFRTWGLAVQWTDDPESAPPVLVGALN